MKNNESLSAPPSEKSLEPEISIKDLLRIDSISPENLQLLAKLPPPEKSPLSKASRNQLRKLASNIFKVWIDFIILHQQLPINDVETKCPTCGMENHFTDQQMWSHIFLALGAYYDYSIYKMIEQQRVGDKELHTLKIHYAEQLETFARGQELNSPYRHSALFVASYLACITFSHIGRLLSDMPLSKPFLTQIDRTVLLYLHLMLNERASYLKGTQAILADRLIDSVLRYLIKTYDKKAIGWNHRYRLGPFSAIKLSEISPLAHRHPDVLRKYGSKQVEKVFEHQLALILESLGFIVVSTRTGIRTADLLRIASDPTDRFTFILEAKTSKHPYSLPTKDERALREYVENIKRSLTTLPPLRFVLMVGHEESKTLSGKLKKFETTINIPTRFLKAQDLATLREQLLSPLVASTFQEMITSGPLILSNETITSIMNRCYAEHTAHRQFVDAMLGARGVISTDRAKAWSNPECHS